MKLKQPLTWQVGLLMVVAALATVAGIMWPVASYVAYQPSDGGPDPVRITAYDVDLTVHKDGSLDAVESITADFPMGRHGIFRFFDVADAGEHGRLVPHDLAISLDGSDVPVDMSWERGRRYRVAKIGDPDSLVAPGTHTYKIAYSVDGVLTSGGTSGQGSWAGADDRSLFSWDVVPGGWQMAMDGATARIHLPAKPELPECAGETSCAVTVDGNTVNLAIGAMAPHTPVSLRTGLDVPTPDRASVPWPVAFDGSLGRSVPVALGLSLFGLLALVLGWMCAAPTREKAPGFPVMYEPPTGLGPVQVAYISNELVPSNAISATLLDLAERGLVELVPIDPANADGGWKVTGVGDPQAWATVDPVSRAVARRLGVDMVGGTFLSQKSATVGKVLLDLNSDLAREARGWGIGSGLLTRTPVVPFLRILLGLCLVVAALLIWFSPLGITLLALPPAAFVIGVVGVVVTASTTHRTAAGREMWSRAGGFRRLLATQSAETRFDFSARKELYTAFIPYAVALGCAEAWARKYEAETGTPAPMPGWYPVTMGTSSYSSVGNPIAGFESSLDSAISAYQATQSRSSGGGGGGFSGGGGFGGGGGGSW
jgi:uncharacterized membrane protein YgcG